jgi:hypothetical protein
VSTLIDLIEEPTPQTPVEILQLYDELELLRLDQPPRHTLFVLGREPDSTTPDRLLLIDPPPDLHSRFRVEGDVAILLSHTPRKQANEDAAELDADELDAPRLETQPGGTAHIRLGNHFLDIFTQQYYSVVFLPALGILYSGVFGSDVDLPCLPSINHSTKQEPEPIEDALLTVRLLASLAKSRSVKLLIPHMGELAEETVPIMERLAADVAYLHNLQRLAPAVQKESNDERLAALAATLLPSTRRSETAQATNLHNLQILRRSAR